MDGKRETEHCPGTLSNCREQLRSEINGMVPRSMVWKGTLLFIAIWGIAYGIYGADVAKREHHIEDNTEHIRKIEICIEGTKQKVDAMERNQVKMDDKLDEVLRQLNRINRKMSIVGVNPNANGQ